MDVPSAPGLGVKLIEIAGAIRGTYKELGPTPMIATGRSVGIRCCLMIAGLIGKLSESTIGA